MSRHSSHSSTSSYSRHSQRSDRTGIVVRAAKHLHPQQVTGVKRPRHARQGTLVGYGIRRSRKIHYAAIYGQKRRVRGLKYHGRQQHYKLRVARVTKLYGAKTRVAGFGRR